ncbi:MAG: DMT family transporter [Deltaproteobacteria bacterium]|nr:DMT family transporter [Deltaproteobacteria bacterium]
MKNQKKAFLFALATVLLWSTVASAFKVSLRFLSPLELLLYSSGVSTLVLGGAVLTTGGWEELRSCPKSGWVRSLLLGFLNPFFYYLILFKAYDLLPAQQAQPINYTWALTLTLLSVPLLGQRIGGGDGGGLLLGYAGVLIISTDGNLLGLKFSSVFGVSLALVSTVIWALYWIFNARDERTPTVALFQSFLLGFSMVLLYFLMVGELRVPDPRGIAGAFYVGIFEMSVTFILWLSALKYAENTARVGSLIFLSPPISLLFIHFVVKESIRFSTCLGLFFILLGLFVQQRFGVRPIVGKGEK